MKKFILILSCLLSVCFTMNAQVRAVQTVSPTTYYNGFANSTNIDSALYFARKLAADFRNADLLKTLLHDDFAQRFVKRKPMSTNPLEMEKVAKKLEFNRLLLDKMILDGNKRLIASVRPIDFWIKIRESEDTDKQRQLTENFIANEFNKNSFYEDKVGRYAFLIHQIILEKKELHELSNQLLNKTLEQLKLDEVKTNVETANRDVLSKRAWQRFLFAYYNNQQGKEMDRQGKKEEAEKFYRTSFEFSPDLTDVNHKSAYFYDTYFLTGTTAINFQQDYLKFIQKNNPDKTKTLSTLLEIALVNPTHKERLRTFYNENFKEREAFSSFWMTGINASLKNAPNFSLMQVDGTKFSTVANKGKWILIDFWGTWCGPCRKEHPDLQKFSKDIIDNSARNITLITIACLDTQEKVETYMFYNKYTFPVAMADERIERTFNIKSYPSKILITPQGKYMVIPFGTDWVSFIDNYTSI